MPVLLATLASLALLRLAWTDMRRFEVDLAAAAVAAAALAGLRHAVAAPVALPALAALTLALLIAATAHFRPGQVGMGDALIMPLVGLAAPIDKLLLILSLYALATLLMAVLYQIVRGKPLSRLRHSRSPAAPAAAIAAMTGTGTLASHSAAALPASLALAAMGVLTLFAFAGRNAHAR